MTKDRMTGDSVLRPCLFVFRTTDRDDGRQAPYRGPSSVVVVSLPFSNVVSFVKVSSVDAERTAVIWTGGSLSYNRRRAVYSSADLFGIGVSKTTVSIVIVDRGSSGGDSTLAREVIPPTIFRASIQKTGRSVPLALKKKRGDYRGQVAPGDEA